MATVINDFLHQCVKKVSSKVHPLTVVQGNEGGDMDSVVGAIYLALLFDRVPKMGIENPVPVINFPWEDLVLRNDVSQFLREIGVDSTLLLSVQTGQSPDNFLDIGGLNANVFMHDHNKLRENQLDLDARVIGIVDHHTDEKKHLELPSDRRILRTVGSACTLVTELYQLYNVDVPCPSLLDAPIVLDTVNFDPAQKKVTPDDIAMHQWLCSKAEGGSIDATVLYAKLSQWKNDVLSLTVAESMRRDYKKFDFKSRTEKGVMATGTSSVPCSCQEFEQKYTVESIIKDAVTYIKQERLDVLIFAFAGKVNGKHSREVAFCATPDTMHVFTPFIADTSDGIVFSKCTDAASDDGAYVYASYSLSDPAVSRKKLVPALHNFLADGGSRSLL